MIIPAITSWLLTYLIHSTVLLGAAWLISKALGDRRMALQEVLLRAALIGGVLTAAIQLFLGILPVAGTHSLSPSTHEGVAGVTASAPAVGQIIAHEPTANSNSLDFWPVALLILWAAGSLAALISLSRSARDLRLLLTTRRFCDPEPILERIAAAMGLRQPVRLSTSKAIAIPFATGITRPEICCPERVSELAPEHKTGLFAHEVAHLARRDPAWQLLYRLGEAILFLQPLNRLVRHRLEEISEHLTDEKAVQLTGSRLGLARCLVVIAHWGISSRIGVPATAFASGPRLDRRVRRLLTDRARESSAPVWAAPFAAAIIFAAVLTLPMIAAGPVDAGAFSDHPAPPVEKTWSEAKETPPEPPTPEPVPEPVVAPEPMRAPEPKLPPEAKIATEPETEPEPNTPPDPVRPPEPATPPEAQEAPSPATEPTKAAPSSRAPTPEERAARRAWEEQRRDFEVQKREADRARARAEEQYRRQEELSRAIAVRQAERARDSDVRRQELAERAVELRTVAEAQRREVVERERERAQHRAEADALRAEQRRVRDIEVGVRGEERRIEAQAEALKRTLESMKRGQVHAEDRARVLEQRARQLAEEAEAERLALEEQQRRNAEKKKEQ